MSERKFACLQITPDAIEGWLKEGFRSALPTRNKLPADARIVDASYSAYYGAITLTFESASFPCLRDGEVPMVLDPVEFTAC